jgi:hypothetical protein
MKVNFQQFFFGEYSYAYLNEKPHPHIVFCEITWVELFIWNWNGTINSYSIHGCQNQCDVPILHWMSCWCLSWHGGHIRIDAWTFFITFGLPSLCVAIKTGFNCHMIGDWILNFLWLN